MPTLYATLARYNRWANARLYAEMEKLDPEQLVAQSAVNFGSILAIANHWSWPTGCGSTGSPAKAPP